MYFYKIKEEICVVQFNSTENFKEIFNEFSRFLEVVVSKL